MYKASILRNLRVEEGYRRKLKKTPKQQQKTRMTEEMTENGTDRWGLKQ